MEQIWMRLCISADSDSDKALLLEIMGHGNCSEKFHWDWAHQLKVTKSKVTFRKAFDSLLMIFLENNHLLQKSVKGYSVALFVEYFSTIDMGTEFSPESLKLLSDYNISLCINHILYNP